MTVIFSSYYEKVFTEFLARNLGTGKIKKSRMVLCQNLGTLRAQKPIEEDYKKKNCFLEK